MSILSPIEYAKSQYQEIFPDYTAGADLQS